ncbi:MAG TPA: tetratricopeptide repeat protein [Planctomycetota bacterium]|nr:tetratricopeptide repeat protein [Planctomycetota bacterium]
MRNSTSRVVSCLILILSLGGMALAGAKGGRWPKGERAAKAPGDTKAAKAAEDEFAARRLLKRAQDLLLARETERAVRMFESVIEQHPKSLVRYEAYLALGKHFIEAHDQATAVNYLRHLNELEKGDPAAPPEAGEGPTGQAKEMYLEGLYLTGVAYFQMRQYAAAFPILRKITNNYANTVWANQSYYYIGMCHFAQGNWNKAIQALSLVGTFVDPKSPSVEYAEAGRRFFVKVEDADLPVLHRLGKQVQVTLTTQSGDKESVACIPLAAEQGIFICSIPTDLTAAKPGDGVLQVAGGDTIAATYRDENTQEGQPNVAREKKVRVVSTAQLRFTLGTFESKANAAFLGQPLFVLLQDLDQDTSAQADTVSVRLLSRYPQMVEEATAAEGLGAALDLREQEVRYVVRDEMTLKLTEQGDAPVHTGRFGGSVQVEPFREGQPIDKTDQVLACAMNDEIVVSYVDELHIGGAVAREVAAHIKVTGEIDSRPRATQNVVPDPVLKAKKEIVESTAYLELAKIFKSMGLTKGAKEKSSEGLDRVDAILRTESPIPSALKEEAFKLKWELYIAQDDFASAVTTCRLFNRLYPDSPFVDQALVGIGTVKLDNKDYPEAIKVFQQILTMPNSQVKAEAQFRIAQCIEAQGPEKAETAIQQYKLCSDRFPESPFAGQSLAKLVDYYVETKDYARADDLLTQVFQDYPDGDFLDGMLLKWVIVAYRMNDFQKSYNKCSQLLFEYPASPHAKKAKEILPKIEAKIKGGDEKIDDKKEEE